MYGHAMKHTAKFPVPSKGDYLWYSIIQMDSSFPAFLISWAYAVFLATDIFVANYWFIIFYSEKWYDPSTYAFLTAHLAYMTLWYNSDGSLL